MITISHLRQLSRPALVHLSLVAFAALLVLRSGYIQLWKGHALSKRAERLYFQIDTIPAQRGDILDSEGKSLVEGFDKVSIEIAPKEIRDKDRELIKKTLAKLGVSKQMQARALSKKNAWVTLKDRYMPADIAPIRGLRGIYPEAVVSRQAFASAGVRALVGRVQDGNAQGGLERVLDQQLRGEPGLIKRVNDPVGRQDREVPVAVIRSGTPGNSVVLTINKTLQGIAEGALANAVNAHSARRGDIVIVEPATGEVRALASYSPALGFASSDMIAEPYEPGSSVKPLLASRLLELRRAKPDEVMITGAELQIPGRKTPLLDDHPAPSRTLHDVIVHSSNIGIVKFADRLTPQEHFEAYRDFGFGMQTGITLPAEAAGQLPGTWGPVERSSTAIGYGMSVTSLQLAMAFASIANGGELLEPAIVKEIRNPDGDVVFKHKPRMVRRVMSPSTAADVRAMLRDVVVRGTASKAEISLGELAGKTGTARLSDGANGYRTGKYTATFAGMFPAKNPQFVIVVRIVDPSGGAYYGGATAAPVSAAVLNAAAVAQDAALDTRSLVSPSPQQMSGPGAPASAQTSEDDHAEIESPPSAPDPAELKRVIKLNESNKSRTAERMARPVPYVDGMPLRAAVYTLHQAGFKVRLISASDGSAGTTSPAAGSIRNPGELVLLYARQ